MNHVLLICREVRQWKMVPCKQKSKVRRTIWGFFPVNLAKKKGIKHDSRQKNDSGNEECLKKLTLEMSSGSFLWVFLGVTPPLLHKKKDYPAPATHHQRQETMSASMALAYSAGVNNWSCRIPSGHHGFNTKSWSFMTTGWFGGTPF